VQISFGKMMLKSKGNLIVLAAIGLASCSSRPEQSPVSSSTPEQPPVIKADKPFVAAGNIEMRLSGGDYIIRAGTDEHIRVSFGGDTGNAAAEVTTSGTRANLSITDTPHSNFRATVEVPATADLTVHLTGGNVEIARITGNKDINNTAGNVAISISNANDYGTVDASVKVGNLDGGPFGDSGSGLARHLKWSGPGKYTLRASLGAGNLELKR
jgi:fibronectin type 3 domain-containing protein